jgi:hypothetical protein
MWMRSAAGQLGAGASVVREREHFVLARIALCLAVCLAAGGCASVGQSINQVSQALASAGPASAQARARASSIVFESIDGLPLDGREALSRDLEQEAAAFHIAVVPAGSDAAYRIRGYVAAHGRGQATAVAWAWDVYDAGLQRAIRLSGEERGDARAGKGTVMDEEMLRRIARSGMAQLADFMASGPPPPAAAPTPPGPPAGNDGNVASRDAPTRVAAWGQ